MAKKEVNTGSAIESLKKKYPNYMKDEKISTHVFPIDYVLNGGYVRGCIIEFSSHSGVGKAQPLSSLVLTKYGYKPMGLVSKGDEIFDGNGNLCKILDIYPQGIRPIYRITFSDRTSIEVSDEHLNVVQYYLNNTLKEQVLTTKDLLNLWNNTSLCLRVPVRPLSFINTSLPVDPYLLGILISEGCLKNNFSISLAEEDLVEKINFMLKKYDCYLHKKSSTSIDYNICSNLKVNSLRRLLKSLNLLCNSTEKFIPKEYLLASYEDRLELLRGLFDGDGYIGLETKIKNSKEYKRSIYEFTTSSSQLSQDFAFLVRSLGIVDTVTSRVPAYKDYTCRLNFRHYLKIPRGLKIFSSLKHENRYIDRNSSIIRKIINIEYVRDDNCQCILVDSPKHTYLTDNLTITHNTTALLHIAKNLIASGERVLYLNIEQAPMDNLLKNMGLLGMPEEKFLVLTPTVISEIEEVMDNIVKVTPLYEEPLYTHIVFDSIGGMLPDMMKDRKTSEITIGAGARQKGDFFTTYMPELKRRGITTWFVNHLSTKIDTSFHGTTTQDSKGGLTFLYYTDIRLRATSGEKLWRNAKTVVNSKDKDIYANIGKITTIKNKIGKPFLECKFPVFFGKGISNVYFIYEILQQNGYVKALGSWMKVTILNPDEPNKQGLQGLLEYIKDNQKAIIKQLKAEELWF